MWESVAGVLPPPEFKCLRRPSEGLQRTVAEGKGRGLAFSVSRHWAAADGGVSADRGSSKNTPTPV